MKGVRAKTDATDDQNEHTGWLDNEEPEPEPEPQSVSVIEDFFILTAEVDSTVACNICALVTAHVLFEEVDLSSTG